MFEQQQRQRKQSLQQRPTIVIIDGKLGNRGVAAGILAIHQRDMELLNNSVIETTLAHFRSAARFILLWDSRQSTDEIVAMDRRAGSRLTAPPPPEP
eukprot:scaffold48318_cov51-Cyclotella_meneghiniana.AAC.1